MIDRSSKEKNRIEKIVKKQEHFPKLKNMSASTMYEKEPTVQHMIMKHQNIRDKKEFKS